MYNLYAYNDNAKITLHEADSNSRIKVRGSLKRSVNNTDALTITMFPGNPCYNSLVPRKTIVEMYDAQNGKRVFRGVVLKPTGEMDASGIVGKTYICAGELDYLSDSIQPYQKASSVTDFFTRVLMTHNSQMPSSKKIYIGQMLVTSNIRSRTWGYTSTYQAINDFIREYGGEIRLRYDGNFRYLDYTSTVWDTGSDTKIELAVNMRSVSFTLDATNIATGIYAVGAKLHNDGTSAERLELGEVIWNADLRAQYGDIVTVQVWDDVTQAENLRTKATAWLTNQAGALHQYTVDAVELSKINKDFDEFEIGTQYAIKNPLIGLDDVVRCISKTIDINDPTQASMTFGDRYETLQSVITTKMAGLNTKIDRTAEDISASQEEYVQEVVAMQTALLRGAEGGYKYDRLDGQGKPIETFFLNSPSINTATQALRINKNGIGFWTGSAGGALNGPYTEAWTIDGTFNTDYIVGRQITGFTFNNGNGTFVVNADGSVTAKNISVVNGSINCGNGEFTVDSSGNVVANSLSSNDATITGGSVNITTADEHESIIQLNAANVYNKLSPYELEVKGTSNNDTFKTTVGAFLGVQSLEGNKGASVSSSGVTVTDSSGQSVAIINTSGAGYFEKLYVKKTGGGWHDVAAELEQI